MTKCPKCGFYMREGYLHAGRGAFFSKDKTRFTAYANEHRGDERLVGLWRGKAPAFYCDRCRLLLLKGG